MHNKYITVIIALLIANVFLAWQVYAQVETQGMLDSPDTPENTQSYTLEDIYNRLDSGAAGAPSAFTEPSAGPTSGTGHTLDEIMAKAPAVDDANGAGPDEVLAGKTFWGLGANGAWGPQTGTAPVAASPKTGQTAPANPGPRDDGTLKKGAAWPSPRFTTNNGDGTVTDNLTGLVWLQNANCTEKVGNVDKGANGGKLNWEDALKWSNSLAAGNCGLNDDSNQDDWRLPNAREMSSLTDFSRSSPPLPAGHPFTNVQTKYWASTTSAANPEVAWFVDLEFVGDVDTVNKVTPFYVWPVRDGQ